MSPSREQVVGVIVTYFPDVPAVRALLAAARPQVRAILVVDNTPADAPAAQRCPPQADAEVISLGFNAGVDRKSVV